MFAAPEAAVGFAVGNSVGEGAGAGVVVWTAEGTGVGARELVEGVIVLSLVASGVMRAEAAAVAVVAAVGTAPDGDGEGPWGLQASTLKMYAANRVIVSLTARLDMGSSSSFYSFLG